MTGTGDTPGLHRPARQVHDAARGGHAANSTPGAGDTINFQIGREADHARQRASDQRCRWPHDQRARCGALTVSGNNATQIFNITAPVRGPGVDLGPDPRQGQLRRHPGRRDRRLPGSGEAAPLTLTNDVISGSTTTATGSAGGGGIYSEGPVTISGSTITGNTAPDGQGGGILVEPSGTTSSNKYDLTITDSTISGNTALTGGGIAGSNNLIVTGQPYHR